MNQYNLLLFFVSLLFNLSHQTQLFRDLAGTTLQNFKAQASQWTLSDPESLLYSTSTVECFQEIILVKSSSVPQGSTLKKTFNDLEDHNLLRFYVKMYYMGDYTSQTVQFKFDDVSIETSQVLSSGYPSECSSLDFTNSIVYFGVVPHIASSITVEFSSNLHNTDTEVSWGLRDFSLVTDSSDTINSVGIYAKSSYQSTTTIPTYPCPIDNFLQNLDCGSCSDPCATCFGPGSDQCFTYTSASSENRLCPQGQTFLTSGCTDCAIKNCDDCNNDVSQCDGCLNTCGLCLNFMGTNTCFQCTPESNLVLYNGDCIEKCPQGMYADSGPTCQSCQIGCSQCSGPNDCIQCPNETAHIDGICICNQPGMYFEETSGACTGVCLLGCEQCVNGQECMTCHSGLTLQSDGSCRCETDGFYYQDETGSCTGQCSDYCDSCLTATSCLSCSGNRVLKGGLCKCQSPRVLIGDNCECPSFMTENPFTFSCQGSSVADVVYQSAISPLFDGILQIRINPITKWSNPPSFIWDISCTLQNTDLENDFLSYVSGQTADLLFLPSRFLEYNLECTVTTYMNFEMISMFVFNTISPAQPQLQIVGGPLQMVSHSEQNFIFAQVKSATGSSISASDLKIIWTQTSGDPIDLSSTIDSSNPLQLTIPNCTFKKGKVYKFKIDVQLKVNLGSEAWQEVTIGVYAPKFQAHITGLTDNYHLSSKSLTLRSQLSFQQDNECPQTNSLSDILDLSTAMYTWECYYLDLDLSPPTTNRLLDESSDITTDLNVLTHPDPLKLFYHSTSSSTLTLPSSYFTQYPGYQFMFYLTVTVQNKDQTPTIESFTVLQPTLEVLKTKAHVAIVLTKPFTTVSFSCLSENDCQAYCKDFSTRFVGSSFNSQYSYSWILNTLLNTQYTTFLRVVDDYPVASWTGVPRILYTISDGTNIASAFFTLPFNYPPRSGNINIYPLEGEAYNTKFSLSTYGWKDTDLPVYYEFYTSFDASTICISRNKMIRTLKPYGETILLPVAGFSYAYVGVLVTDNLKSTSESAAAMIFLSNSAQTFCEALNKSSQAFALSQKSDNLFQRLRLVTVILESLASWEEQDSICMSDNYDFKFTAITQVNEIVETFNSKQEFKVQLLKNIIWSANPEYNQDKNWNLYNNTIDSYYLSNFSKAILHEEEYQPLMKWTDYQIWYMKKPNSTYQDPDKIYAYINLLLRSTLTNALPVDDGITYQGSFYSSFTYKTTYCKVLQDSPYLTYGLYGLKPNVTLKPGQEIPPEKCNNLVDMIFLAFRSNYTLTVDSSGNYQDIIYFDLIDSVTGKSLLDIFTFILLSPISTCPLDYICYPTGDGGTEIYGIFDLRDQINKIFAKSKIDQIQNISVLAHFQFWKSIAFWTVMVFSIWFLLSFYWLYVKHPTYCALTSKKNMINKAPLLKKIHLFFWVIHPLVGIYVYNDNKTTKPIKLAIYYQRLVIVMVYSTIFSSLDSGEGWIFKGYLLLFNTVTVTPVNAILGRVFERAFKTGSKKKITSKIQLSIGIICYLALLVACFLVMFIIEAQQDASQNKTWAFNFLIAFIQDLSLSPALSAINKVMLVKFSLTERVTKKIKSQRIKNFILSDDFKSIYDTIFTTATTRAPTILTSKDPGLSPRSIIMSPISSTRKFLKFTTLESPQTTKNNTQFDFRTRIASENEIGSVDFIAAETLVSNRFQTLFPEAKAEAVRPTSPTKQNFEKMQTTKTSFTNFPTLATTLKGSILKQKPFQTIEFNVKDPVEMTLDDIFQFAEQPDEGEEIQASQLKLWKNHSKTILESPTHEKKNNPLRISEKTSTTFKKKDVLKQNETKPSQFMELSSINNQFKEPSGFHPDELSSFDGDKHVSELKLWKNNSKKNAPSYLPSVDMSLERGNSEKANALFVKKGQLKQSEVTLTKPFPLIDLSSMNQFKEQPSGALPDEFSSFDGNAEQTFASQLKLWKNNSKTLESPSKKRDLTKSVPSGDLASVPKKITHQFNYNETTPHKLALSMEISSILQFKEPIGSQVEESSSFDENVEKTIVSLPKFKTVEHKDKKEKPEKSENPK